MSGSSIGGRKAAETNKARHGKDFYKTIGKLGKDKAIASGGAKNGGFAYDKERARIAGTKGGENSRRLTEADRSVRDNVIMKLTREGLTVQDIMLRLNIGSDTVYSARKRYLDVA